MSVPFGRAVLTLDDITKQIRRTFERFPDPRRGKNTRYTLVDAGLSAFSVFFMQSPSFLDASGAAWTSGWAKTTPRLCLGCHQIPVGPSNPRSARRHRTGTGQPIVFLSVPGVASGGRGGNLSFGEPDPAAGVRWGGCMFSSSAIPRPQCSVRQHANGSVTDSHTAVTPVLVKPVQDKVIPLAPELVRPQDGVEKQDCELNAAQRWLRLGRRL